MTQTPAKHAPSQELPAKSIDVVIMWVDDQFDGYQDLLGQYAEDAHDTNPNRTRDNLELLRYCLRSLDQNMPEMRHLYLFTQRPQCPDWLNAQHPDLRIVHHDQVADPAILPTFNSFSILSHVHMLPDLSDQYVFFEDDMMLAKPGLMQALTRDGRPLSLFKSKTTKNADALDPVQDGPWNHALANSNRILNETYGDAPRQYAIHGPRLFDRNRMSGLEDRFADAFTSTRRTRFRDGSNIPLEYFYPHAMVEEGNSLKCTQAEADQVEGYVSLENLLPWTWFQLWRMKRRGPYCYTLNDSFNDQPNPRVERFVKNWLNREFPTPSRFER
ncbi:hypothetical protein [Shimia sp.]|uniref:hypothetical protein n=1 Tax=Shimia sp. TaxID=1954381 RepID=UPI00329A3BAF